MLMLGADRPCRGRLLRTGRELQHSAPPVHGSAGHIHVKGRRRQNSKLVDVMSAVTWAPPRSRNVQDSLMTLRNIPELSRLHRNAAAAMGWTEIGQQGPSLNCCPCTLPISCSNTTTSGTIAWPKVILTRHYDGRQAPHLQILIEGLLQLGPFCLEPRI